MLGGGFGKQFGPIGPVRAHKTLNTTFYGFQKRQLLAKSDFCSSDFRKDHLKMIPDAWIYPKSTLPTPGAGIFCLGGLGFRV